MTSTSTFDDCTHCRPTGFFSWIARHIGKVAFMAIAAVVTGLTAHFFVPPAIAFLQPYYDAWFTTAPTSPAADHQPITASPPVTSKASSDQAPDAAKLNPPIKKAVPTPDTKAAKHPAPNTAKPARAYRHTAATNNDPLINRRHYAFETHSIPMDTCMHDRSECGVIAIPKSLARARGWQSNLHPRFGYWTVYADHFLWDYTYYVCPQGIRSDRHLCWETKTKPTFYPFALPSTQAQWNRYKASRSPDNLWDMLTKD